MNMLEEKQMNETILKVLKECPPLLENSADSLADWEENICIRLHMNPFRHPQLATRLTFIWLSQVKGITMYNMENGFTR